MYSPRWSTLALALSLTTAMLIALLIFLKGEAAQSTPPRPDPLSSHPSTHSVENMGPLSISDSSMITAHCYEPGKTQTLCFTVYNGSTDAEWLDSVRVTFPTTGGDWSPACKSQDPAAHCLLLS